jgi:hypothetical protein
MKKLLFALAVCSMFTLVSCDTEKDPVEKDKLLSKTTETNSGDWGHEFQIRTLQYDNLNRITKMSWEWDHVYTYQPEYSNKGESYDIIAYNSNGTISQFRDINIQYRGDTVFFFLIDEETQEPQFSSTHLLIDANGRLLKIFQPSWNYIDAFTYNSNGNVIKYAREGLDDDGNPFKFEWIFEYSSTVQAVFRHANTPEWIITWQQGYWLPTSGHMPIKGTYLITNSEITNSWSEILTYTMDGDYVKTRTREWEWIGNPFETSRFSMKIEGFDNFHQAPQPMKRNRKNTDENEGPVMVFEYINAK